MPGVFVVFLLGLELDLCSAHLLGPWAGAFVVTFGLIAAMSQHVFVESPLAVALVVGASTIVSTLVYAGLVYEFKPAGAISFWGLFGEALITAVIGPILFIGVRAILPPEDKTRSGRLSSNMV